MPADVLRTQLPNGLTLLVRRDASAPVAAVVTWVRAGYFDETDDMVGISHVLEHMFFKGTPTRGVGEVARATRAQGGYLNAHTIYDHTSYVAVLPREGFLRGLEIQADAYANALIDAGELRRELEVIIQEAKRKLDAPGPVTLESLYALLHDRHRIRRWRIGDEAALRRLTPGAVRAFYRNFYRPRNTILAIVGDVDVDAVTAQVAGLYGRLDDVAVRRDAGPHEVAPPGYRYREMAGDIGQSHFAVGWRTPGVLHADTPALDLFANVLGEGRGSRLYRAVRERRLASRVTAFNYTPDELGVFAITGEGDIARLPGALTAAWTAVRRLADAGPRPEEMERARHLFEARWLRRLETMEGQADLLAEWEGAGGWQLADHYFENVMALEAGAVAAAARRYLDPDQASVLVYRPAGTPAFAGSAAEARERISHDGVPPLDAAALVRAASFDDAPATTVAGRPALERRAGTVSVFRTPAGVPILVRQRAGASMAHVGIYFGSGAALEPAAMAGLATLAARTALKGTDRRGAEEIALATELLGGVLVPTVTTDGQGWTLTVPASGAAAAIALLADVVQRPCFPADALETERAIVLAQLAQLRDDMYRYPVRLATRAAFARHPYGRGAIGSEQTLGAVTVEALHAWHRAEVLSGPAVLAIVSGADPADAAALLAAQFDGIRPAPPRRLPVPPWPDAPAVEVERRERAQTAQAIGFPSPARGDADRTVAGVLAAVASGLGGRLFDALRDRRSLAYTVTAYPVERVAAGLFVAYIATSPDLEDAARDGMLAELERLGQAPVTPEELDRARMYVLGAHAIAQQSGGAMLAEMVDAWLYGDGLEEIETFRPRVEGVTADGIRAFAEVHLRRDRRVEGIVRGTPPAESAPA